MARIAGVNVPSDKKVRIGLRYVYGIGQTRADQICSSLLIPDHKRVKDLTEAEVAKIREFIEANYIVEGDLRREVYMSIKRLTDLGCYRGLRHRKRLPVRGQRTSCNAKTVRRVSPVSANN